MKRVAILCCAGTGNFGDDIIFEGLVKRLAREGWREFFRVFRINGETIQKVNECDFLVIGGGELLSGTDILSQIVDHDIKIPYEFRCVGVGSEEDIVPHIGKLHPLRYTVRTPADDAIMKSCGVEAKVEFDPIFEFASERYMNNGRVALCLRNENKSVEFIDTLAHELDFLIDAGARVDLVGVTSIPRHQRHYHGEEAWVGDCNDAVLVMAIASRMRNRCMNLIYSAEPQIFMGELGCYDGIVSERLHPNMAAWVRGVPFLCIPTFVKSMKFLNMIGKGNLTIGDSPVDIVAGVRRLSNHTQEKLDATVHAS